MARRGRADYKDQVETRYPDNGVGDIEPQDDRDDKTDIADSAVWWDDDVVTDLSSPNDLTVPTTKAVSDAIYEGSSHDRGDWDTTDTLPDNGSGTSGAIVYKDEWIVPEGSTWNYLGNIFPQWTHIKAMKDAAAAFEDFKIY